MYRKRIIDGYCDKVVTYDKPLEYCPHGSAGVIQNKYGTHLVSYTTRVISISPEGWLDCTGTYSATTRKHIGAFLKEYAPALCYYDVKRAFLGDYEININTGECRSIFNR